MTDTLSSMELATNSVVPCRYSADGSRPTLMVPTWAPLVRSTMDTVPVATPPVTGFDTMSVPSDRLVESPAVAGRPPSLDTYALSPTSTTWRGALPTGISEVSVLVAVSMTPSVLLPFSATYSLPPSGDSATPPGSPSPCGPTSLMTTGAETLPSSPTVQRTMSEPCWDHSVLPSGEYSGGAGEGVASPQHLSA